MSEISSGLVAVAEVAFSLHLGLYAAFVGRRQIEVGDKLVRLSDAEAIISAKDAEIERLNSECDRLAKADSKNYRDNGLPINEEFYKQAELIEKQSVALQTAREALFDMQDSYAAVHGWKDSFVIAATTAIAAIDNLLKGE